MTHNSFKIFIIDFQLLKCYFKNKLYFFEKKFVKFL